MLQLSPATRALMDDIERRIDPETEEDYVAQWHGFLYGRFTGDIFVPQRQKCSPPGVPIPQININDALESYDTMLQHQLAGVSAALAAPTGSLAVRANYGTGILSSLFGAELFVMPRATNTLPTTRPFNDTARIRAMVQAGLPALTGGLGGKVFGFGEFYAAALRDYPKISRYVTMYHPDLQGPLDICELLWGGEMFYAMYDDPDLVHAALTLVADTYTAFMHAWQQMYPARQDITPHWGNLWHRGAILLRDDSAMNLSPALYREYAAPYDARLLKEFGGGAVHFCGRGDHYIADLCAIPGLTGINLSQPEYNDMETVYRHTVDKGIHLLGFAAARALADVHRPGAFGHNLSV